MKNENLFTLRLPRFLDEWLKKKAKKMRRSKNAYLIDLLISHKEASDLKHEPEKTQASHRS